MFGVRDACFEDEDRVIIFLQSSDHISTGTYTHLFQYIASLYTKIQSGSNSMLRTILLLLISLYLANAQDISGIRGLIESVSIRYFPLKCYLNLHNFCY